MSVESDALVRLGLALFRHSERSDGASFVPVQDLVFNEIVREAPRSIFSRLFGGSSFDFWKHQEDLAKQLAATGLAEMHSRPVAGDEYKRDYYVKLTALGQSLFRVASSTVAERADVGSIAFEDLDVALRDAQLASALANDLSSERVKITALPLTNAESTTAQAYVGMLIAIAEMPEPDATLFWKILERLNQFAGVASLIVAIIALRLAK